MKESVFAYISNTEEMFGSGWEAFKDCGTEALRDKNGSRLMKKSKDITKVVRTYRLMRISRLDRQMVCKDNKDEENSYNTDDDADFMISSDKKEENEGLDQEVDDKVATAVSWSCHEGVQRPPSLLAESVATWEVWVEPWSLQRALRHKATQPSGGRNR